MSNEINPGVHKSLAIMLFNHTWELMEKTDRSPDEIDEMIHAAHASRYHWGIAGEALHRQRGEWQISRVYALLKRAEPCLFHARRCLEITLEYVIDDFDLAFAYEALARAYSLLGIPEETTRYLKLAEEAGMAIDGGEDSQYFFEELRNIAIPGT